MSGKLPEKFLRGCGLPDDSIAYIDSLGGEPFRLYSCFINYSHKDEAFAKRLHADLQENEVKCWYAPENMESGKKIHYQIDDVIKLHDKLLLILSDESRKSGWVETEIRKARSRELKEGKQMLFPLRLCPFSDLEEWELFNRKEGTDLAEEVREYYILDFSNWDTDN